MDRTTVRHFTSETKQTSKQSKHSDSPTLRTAEVVHFAESVAAVAVQCHCQEPWEVNQAKTLFRQDNALAVDS